MAADPGARVRAALDELGADHQVLDCDPDLADTAAFCEHYGVAPERSANTILVAGRGRDGARTHVACVVLATTRLDVNGAVRRRLGVRKASFASADETRELTGMLIGGVTAFALPAGLPVWIDAAVVAEPWVIVGGGDRSTKIKCAPEVLTRVPDAEVIDGLATREEWLG